MGYFSVIDSMSQMNLNTHLQAQFSHLQTMSQNIPSTQNAFPQYVGLANTLRLTSPSSKDLPDSLF
jgi:hypothetical protein